MHSNSINIPLQYNNIISIIPSSISIHILKFKKIMA